MKKMDTNDRFFLKLVGIAVCVATPVAFALYGFSKFVLLPFAMWGVVFVIINTVSLFNWIKKKKNAEGIEKQKKAF